MSNLTKIFFGAFLMTIAGLAPLPATAGGIRLVSGSLALLKNAGRVNLEYDYSDMKVGRKPKDCVPEQEFIARENLKKAGRGDAWKLEWIGSRIQCQPKFQELLNKQFASSSASIEFGGFKDAKYTLILETKAIVTSVEGFHNSPPFLTADAVFVETKDRTKTVAVVKMNKLSGRGFWILEMREAYAKAGKDLGILIRDKIK